MQKKSFFAIKIYLSKAYDKLNWDFIAQVLREPNILVNMLSVETNVMWNGDRIKFFRPQRGIRQCDPISPHLFVLCMYKLSRFIEHEVTTNKWKEIRMEKHGPSISHLIFVNNLLLFWRSV